MRLVWLSLVLVVLASRVAAAQPSTVAPAPPPTPKFKNPPIAVGMSLGATFGGLVFFAALSNAIDDDAWRDAALVCVGASVAVGPSAGHLYAGEYGHSAVTSVIRGAAFGAFAYGVAKWAETLDSDDFSRDDDNSEAYMLGGLGVWGALTLYDFIDGPSALRRANRRAAAHVTVAPTVVSAGGTRAPGLVLGGSF